ncbi:unnamed protein product [Darwinula stevensoni]|uniref:mRNA guanylyltransferase n=1 Tax=Darwinula stevensoni TaxID=69355 RepID=A0A7R9AAU2_9CRUS|nr:unnamed protein product [Darwinula stevensoni]CAG0898456.1 unnamed protein product [Darwinula stevensoni]
MTSSAEDASVLENTLKEEKLESVASSLKQETSEEASPHHHHHHHAGGGRRGRLKFFLGGRVLLELSHCECGDKATWVEVSRKTYWPPGITNGPTPPCPTPASSHKHESSASDASSVQSSSPWLRDHPWKQTCPRKNLSKELSFFFRASPSHKHIRTKMEQNILRTPWCIVKCENGNVENGASPSLTIRAPAKRKNLDMIIKELRSRLRRLDIDGCSLSSPSKPMLVRGKNVFIEPGDPSLVSPRKRFLRDAERKSTGSAPSSKLSKCQISSAKPTSYSIDSLLGINNSGNESSSSSQKEKDPVDISGSKLRSLLIPHERRLLKDKICNSGASENMRNSSPLSMPSASDNHISVSHPFPSSPNSIFPFPAFHPTGYWPALFSAPGLFPLGPFPPIPMNPYGLYMGAAAAASPNSESVISPHALISPSGSFIQEFSSESSNDHQAKMSWKNRNGPGPIPPRWLNCPRKSSNLIGGKFLAFKTPLDSKFDDQVPDESLFYPEMVIQSMKSYQVSIGLWIDLTNTTRFYNPKFLENLGIKYCKLECRGHGETPSPDQTRTFIEVCDAFIRQNPLLAVAVHCTHGFNRTGFLISSYLIEKCDWAVDAAVTTFAENRPPGIYKGDYLQELFRRYADVEDAPPAPALPDWCMELDDVDDDGDQVTCGSSDKVPVRMKKAEIVKKNPEFMEGVPGVTPVMNREKLGHIQRRVQEMCEWRSRGFPGSQPVSMDRQNISFLSAAPYKVSWKADGTRYLMLIDGAQEIYFIDRDNCVFHVKMLTFPKRKELNRHISDTLVDGEMVIDEVKGKKIPRFLIYDIIRFQGNKVGQMDFNVRLMCIRREIVEPRHAAMASGAIDRTKEPFSVRPKDFYDLVKARSLLGPKFRKDLAHPPDGLIFQPVNQAYIAGRCDSVLKWKPPSMNSVDFRLKIVEENREGMLKKSRGLLFVGGLDTPFAEMKVTRDLRQYNNKIIECKFENPHWVFMRERTDKSFPNAYETASSVWETIRNPVTEDFLLDYIDEAVMPPPPDSFIIPPPNDSTLKGLKRPADRSEDEMLAKRERRDAH